MIGGIICNCLGPGEVMALMVIGLCIIAFTVLWYLNK